MPFQWKDLPVKIEVGFQMCDYSGEQGEPDGERGKGKKPGDKPPHDDENDEIADPDNCPPKDDNGPRDVRFAALRHELRLYLTSSPAL